MVMSTKEIFYLAYLKAEERALAWKRFAIALDDHERSGPMKDDLNAAEEALRQLGEKA